MKRALAIAVVFLTVGSVVASFFTEAERGVVVLHVALTAMFASWTVLGLIVTIRRPDNGVGWLLIATGIFGATFIFSEQVALFVSYGESSLTAAQNAVAFAGLNFTFTFACLALLFLVFPTGHLLSQRWRWAVWFVGATAVIAAVGIYPVSRSVVDVEQFLLNNWSPEFAAFTPTISATLDIINLTTMGSLLVGAAGLVMRMRTAMGVERQQVKWVVYAGVVTAVTWTVFLAPGLPVWILPYGSVPLAIALTSGFAIALLRHRLYDIDRLISRTVVYTAVVFSLIGVYAAGIFVLRNLLSVAEGDLAVAGSTLAVAALFNPVRTRVQSLVDRRFYRSRYDARQVVDAFSHRLADEIDLDTLTVDWLATR